MKSPNLSVICCYNSKDVYENALVASIQKQSLDIELIGLDNTHAIFPSAAHALNTGALQAHGKYLVFIHQDVEIEDPDFFKKLLKTLVEQPVAVYGVAGADSKGFVLTNITQGKKRESAGPIQLETVQEVETLDEVLIALTKELFDQHRFDEKTCNHWHLYGVELCLRLKTFGVKSLVLPLSLHHLSSGKLSKDYALNLYKVIRKHHKNYAVINTTCSRTKTDFIRSTRYVLRMIWDHHIKVKA